MSHIDHLSGLSAPELRRMEAAARRFEATVPQAVLDTLPIDTWLVRVDTPPLVFFEPVGSDSEEVRHEPLIGVRLSALLICTPAGWLRIVSRVSSWRLRELEAAEVLAREFRHALRRSGGMR